MTHRRRETHRQRSLGKPATFEAHATESVWELAEHRYLVVLETVGDA